MSLGLNDLKKRSPKSSANTEGASASFGGGARVSQKARPWSTSNLLDGKPSSKNKRKPTRQAYVDGASMTEEWANEHAGSLHAFNMETQSALAMLRDLKAELQDQARELEQKLKRAAWGPFTAAKTFARLLQK